MHIALTVGSFNRLGGIERVTVQLALGYQALGHDVTVYATDWERAFEDRFSFERVSAPARPAWARTLVLPAAVSRKLAGSRYDFVHGQGTSTYRCDLLTYHTCHAAWLELSARQDPSRLRAFAKRLYPFHRATIAVEKRQALTHTGMFHACSRAVRDEVVTHYGIEPARVAVIPWGIDLEAFRPDAEARRRQRAEWGVDEATPVLLLVANEFNRKGLAQLLEAMARLGRPEVQLMIAGRGNAEPYLPEVARLGLGDRVRFLGHREVIPCYQAADLFVMPTSYEGWALVIGESLACGLPVLTSRFAGSSDLISPGRNGWLLDDPGDVEALTRTLETALEPENLRVAREGARPSVADASWIEVSRRLLEAGTGASRPLVVP